MAPFAFRSSHHQGRPRRTSDWSARSRRWIKFTVLSRRRTHKSFCEALNNTGNPMKLSPDNTTPAMCPTRWLELVVFTTKALVECLCSVRQAQWWWPKMIARWSRTYRNVDQGSTPCRRASRRISDSYRLTTFAVDPCSLSWCRAML